MTRDTEVRRMMGTWGFGPFENDNAQDWVLEELEGHSGAQVLGRAIRPVADSEPDENIDAPSGEIALAAAEVVAAINGYPAADLPWQAHAYLGRPLEEPVDQLKYLALLSVNRVLAANSELAEVWSDASSEDSAAWRASIDDLCERLSAPSRERPPLGAGTRVRLAGSMIVERLGRVFVR
jgi:Domain of unknown function (DUF4259)